jgi:long-chain acyl-CoA synthetase
MWAPPQRLLQDSLVAAAGTVPEKTVLVDEYGECTYADLYDRALRFACALQDAGLARGDRVALYLDNSIQCATAIYGVLLAGGVFTVLNPQTKVDKLTYILNDSEATFLVSESHSAAVATAAAAHAPTVRQVYATAGAESAVDLRATIESADPQPRAVSTIPLDLAALVYTSGTTGRPKGVMLSHQAFVFAVDSIIEYLRLDSGDRILSILPLAFTYGLNQLLLTTRLGATLLLERSFTFPAKTLNRMRAERPTVFPAVPTVYVTILGLTHDEPYDSVRCLTNAAAGLPPALHERIRTVFPNASLFRMYGQTECQRVCYLDPDLIDRKPTSIGKAIPGTEATVLDDLGRPVEPGEVGVLHVRGPHVMLGYWRAPELTAHALREGPFPGERMLCTHDHFTVDADGDLYFVDRSDDVIKTRGEKVSSVEVENTLHDIPGVRLAAVVGVPDPLLGQAIRAYIVPNEGIELEEQAVIRFCRGRLENFMVPQEIVIVDELPRTESGKVRKKSLRREPTPERHISGLAIDSAGARED